MGEEMSKPVVHKRSIPLTPMINLMHRVALAALVLLGCGCGKPPTLMQKYVFDYPSPTSPNLPAVKEGIKVEQFSVAQAFNSTDMVYQPQSLKSDVYQYHRWRVNPGYLVTDYLIRDLRHSGLFQAVLPYGSSGNCRFLLEGGVEVVKEIDAPEGWEAALTLNITLLDVTQEEIPKRVVFQKNYRALEPMPERTPHGLAQGISRAMEKLSAQIITDVYQAARRIGK